MKIVEYGKMNDQVIVLLHGGGLSWWNFREAAALLQNRYHVVIPILDGHAGSDADFVSIEQNARALIAYIDEAHGGSVDLIGGVSLGGQILLDALAQRSSIARYALIESALALPMKLTHALTSPMIDMSYGLIKKKWFSKLQFQSLKMKKELYDEYYRDTCRITKENMIAFLKANSAYSAKNEIGNSSAKSFIFVGEKEPANMLRSAHKLNCMLPGSTLTILKNRHHGEFSINHAQEYADTVIRILENE